MRNLPDWLKWLVLAAALLLLGGLLLAVNDRASRVAMPEPDDTFGIYRGAAVQLPEEG